MLFRHILAAYDGSTQAQKALDKAIGLADVCGGTKLSIVHVINLLPVMTGDLLFTPTPAIERSTLEKGEQLLKDAAQRASRIVRLQTELLHGQPAKVILEQAEERGCDLIVLGSRGLSALGGWVLGSVSHNVVHHAKVPVMVFK